MKLTGPQKNSLRTALLILEEWLDEIEELCKIKERHGILYSIKNTLTEHESLEVRKQIGKIKEIIRDLVNRLGLKSERTETKSRIISILSSLWEILCDIDSKGLRAYGEVDESSKEELDLTIKHLSENVNKIVDLIGSKKSK